jgi:lipopolysaccharide/colanic/teichoic acid biosynthesis glycosyltransferase
MYLEIKRRGPATRPVSDGTRSSAGNVVRRCMSTLRGQLLALAALGILLPVLVRHGIPGEALVQSASFQNSLIACFLAAMFGLVVTRRVSEFPGTTSFSVILPSYAIAFGLVSMALLALRIEYSASLLFLSFTASVVTGFGIIYAIRSSATLPFFVVPNGGIELMHEVPEVNWILLTEPELPTHPEAVIVADLRAEHGFEWEHMLARAALAGIPVYHSKNVRESITGKVHIEHLSENHLGTLSVNVVYRKLKRLFDLIVCGTALVVLAVPMLILCVLIRLDSPGPAIFRQRRIGYGGKPFLMLKFRTMYEHPASAFADPLRNAMTVADDDRITRFGRFLRRTRLDELPQLINVIIGQMSLIGPRPEAVPLSTWYSKEVPFYLYRHIVRPGITGWAQVNQGHVAELEDVNLKLHYDFFYIKNFSFWIDLLITMKTCRIMITGFGAK